MSDLRLDASADHERLQLLLAKQQQIQAEIAALLPSPTHQHHRTPIHKQQQQRRTHVPRSMSSSGTVTMARTPSDRNGMTVPPQRTFSQQSAPAPSMARANSRGTSSQRSGNLPFTSNGNPTPPILHTESRRDMLAWASQEAPFNSQALSHQPHQMQRSMSQSQRKPDLEQVLEGPLGDLDDPSEYIFRTMGTPTVSVSPSVPTYANTLNTYQLSGNTFNTPSTPTSDSLTMATTLTSDMSRQNSIMTINEPLLESMQMMKCSSNTSYSQNFSHDQTLYDQVSSHFTSSRRSSEEQSQLLAGAGGASHESQFPHPFSFTSSGLSGEKMEKCQSNESTSSLSSNASSRSKQRLQAQINLAAARPLMPKGGSDDTPMSRDNSSQSMNRLDSKDGSSDKVAISSKTTYQRPKHDRVKCKLCDSHQEGFRGEHELRRHVDREHKSLVKKWVCEEPKDGLNHPKPVLPLSRCKACHQQKKKYGAYYNAAAHLRRAHFKPKKPARTKSNAKVEDGEKRGGKGGGDWPPMSELKYWMKEVEEQVTQLTEEEQAQQDAADASDDENIEMTFDDNLFPQQTPSGLSGNSFDRSLSDASPIQLYPTAINTNIYGMSNMPLDLTGAGSQGHCMDAQSMYTPSSQSSFPSFSPNLFQNDAGLAFFDSSSSLLSQNFHIDDQGLLTGPDFVDSFYP
ncbi:hypothetical protein V8E51_019178 [Hyaloscypha variabilis]